MVMNQVSLTMVAVLTATIAFASQEAPRIAVNEAGGVYRVTAVFHVPSPPAAVAAVLTDYERIAEFMPGVHTSEVLSRGDAGVVVEQAATAKFLMFSKDIHLVLDVTEDGDTISFRDRCGTSFASYDGAWRLTGAGDGTIVSYVLSAEPSFEVPGFVLKRLLKRDAAMMINRLKAEIAKRQDRRQ